MLYKIARGLQLLGLIIAPIGIAGNLAEQMAVKDTLLIAGAGIVVFILGWLLQESVRPR